ncbi:hypothetical protein P3X46_026929 [Hevea brasiliensis]|uniref:Uncharacterized protein n=1 Tax=Hevea brasiliensis TaxID=3981 RepID=A0ABQ9KY94_HEVBR|nr:hypothetical protein P3X46_026929 [Hevea brasiliensis]
MNPYEKPLTPYEQRLRDEVIYLHSLWHRGPPALNPNPNRLRPKPFHNSNNNPSRNLHVSYPTSFKKTKGNKHGYQNAKNSTPSGSGSSRQPDPGPEWPINPPRPSSPPNSSSGWPSFKVKPSPSAQFTPGIHEAKIATMQMQQKIVKCCNEFFGKKADLDSEEDNKFEEEDEGDDSFGDDNDVEETDEYKFFFGLFVEHRELRDFYEKNQETGDFYCLVCGGMGVKVGKMFKGCLGLVQHAIAILRTKRKRAHRALGQVICRVLGWDFGRLPVVVLKDEPLSQSLASLGDTLNNCSKIDMEQDFPWGAIMSGTTEVEFVTMPVNIEPLYLRTKAILLDSAVPTLNESGDEAESKKEFRGEETYDSFGDDNDVEETDEYKFFFGLFVEHRELRDFYEKNQETGDFYCLVCGGMGVKVGKMFKGCLGLVQHAIAILRTKRKRAHRALGQVICRVLGWDFGRLPVVVLKDEPLSQSLASLGDTLVHNQ